MDSALLRLDGLHKHFGGVVVTDAVSLEVQGPGIHALIGPNGAGKTTLVNLISGVLRPDAGRIHFAGQDITALPLPRRARLGLARSFQITAVLPDFTVRENVALAAQARSGSSFRLFGRAATERGLNEAAMAAIAQLGLEHRAATPAGLLSHGEKRQLELAIALAQQPRLLLLDEPLAGAGPEETERLVGILRGLAEHHAVLLVEHDMQAVFALARRISVLVYGRVIATGTPAEIRADAAVRAAYLGEDEAGCGSSGG